MNQVEIMKRIIDDYQCREITHHEIIKWTNTNCPYGVLRQLKKYYEIEYEEVTGPVKIYNAGGTYLTINKRYRKYKIIKKKEKQCQKI